MCYKIYTESFLYNFHKFNVNFYNYRLSEKGVQTLVWQNQAKAGRLRLKDLTGLIIFIFLKVYIYGFYNNTFANSLIKMMVFPDSCSIGFTYGYSHLTPSG